MLLFFRFNVPWVVSCESSPVQRWVLGCQMPVAVPGAHTETLVRRQHRMIQCRATGDLIGEQDAGLQVVEGRTRVGILRGRVADGHAVADYHQACMGRASLASEDLQTASDGEAGGEIASVRAIDLVRRDKACIRFTPAA